MDIEISKIDEVLSEQEKEEENENETDIANQEFKVVLE
jgi:hypothetical protein